MRSEHNKRKTAAEKKNAAMVAMGLSLFLAVCEHCYSSSSRPQSTISLNLK